jgi:hypothetical protein
MATLFWAKDSFVVLWLGLQVAQPFNQRIQYAKSKSHAIIKEEEGPEALYMHKIGLHDAKTERLTVSGAEKALEASKNKRELDQGDGEAAAEEPLAKKARQAIEPADDEGKSFSVCVACVIVERVYLCSCHGRSRVGRRRSSTSSSGRPTGEPTSSCALRFQFAQ